MCIGLAAIGAGSAVSQGITIDNIDMKAIYAVGNRITYHHDTMTASVDIKSAGGPAVWDFSGFGTNYLEIRKGVALSGNNYPQATHALIDTAFAMKLYMSILGTPTAIILNSSAAYHSYVIGDDVRYLGIQGAGTIHQESDPGTKYPVTAQWYTAPSSVELDLPVSYLKTWSCSYSDSLRATASNLPLIGTYTFTQLTPYAVTYEVDAYGLLTLPQGEPQEALRIRKTSVKNSAVTEVWYLWVAKNGATVQILLRDGSATGGTVAVDDIRWSPGVIDVPVPIQLASFTASRWNGTSIDLAWSTLSETNNFGFFVQRKAAGDAEYADLPGSFIPGHGTTTVPQSYGYRDESCGYGTWWYRLKQIDLDGTVHLLDAVAVEIVASVEDGIPASSALEQNWPNPFNPRTNIGFRVSGLGSRWVRLAVYDLLGREVAVLVNAQKEPGNYEVKFDAAHLPSGVYLYRLTAGDFSETRKLMLMR